MGCAGTTTGETCGGTDRISVFTFETPGIDPELTYEGCYADVKRDRAMNAAGFLSSPSMTNGVSFLCSMLV